MGNKTSSSSLAAQKTKCMREVDSISQVHTIPGRHRFQVQNYSVTKGLGIGKDIRTGTFSVGGYKWVIQYYPDGDVKEASEYFSLYLRLVSESGEPRINCSLSLLDCTTGEAVYTTNFTHSYSPNSGFGYRKFLQRNVFEDSNCLRGDSFTIICDVTILKGPISNSSIVSSGVPIPPCNIHERLGYLLSSKKGVDITFEVSGKSFHAHKCVLAASSPVFEAQLFGSMEEAKKQEIKISDMEAPVFKAMLHFIYNDTLPEFEKHADIAMTQHVLVAADKYMLERLRSTCQQKLCKNVDISNVCTNLALAERHNLTHLKNECLNLLDSPKALISATKTDGFEHLVISCPSIVTDFLSRMVGESLTM